jgi:hypothetical protein
VGGKIEYAVFSFAGCRLERKVGDRILGMNIFLSHAVSIQDAPLAARLRAVAASYGMQILLPDRSNPGMVMTDLEQKLPQADVVLVLITNNAVDLAAVNFEMAAAHQLGKPILALVEDTNAVAGLSEQQIVKFNRFNPVAHEHKLMAALQQLGAQNKADWTALGWIAAIALGFVALSSLSDEKPNK